MTLYDYEVNDMENKPISLKEYQGKVLLIVNTATHCKYTSQYTELQKIYEKYNKYGFEILDFPSNQFDNQSPGTAKQIYEFRTSKYHVTFPQFAKIEVNGEHEEPLYKYLKSEKKSLLNSDIKWNFTKFLIDRNGTVVKRYSPDKKFDAIEKDIEDLLNITK